ncbi:putative ribonuclease H-like domain-containing protein, partial [Tanacetum coccineum]
MTEPMPTIPTQSPFTYPNPNPSASPSFTQDDTSESFIPEPTQPMPTFTQPAFSQPNQSIFSQPAVHFQQTQPTQTNQTGQQYPNNVQSQQFQQFQTASISANNAKFPYLEKDKYEIWAMKMEYWIQNADHNLWRCLAREHPRRLGKDAKGNTIVHPPVSLDEHVAVQRENKVRTLLLQALPEDHMPDFHHYDDARDIWMAVKARFGGNEESKKMRKTMLKQQFTEFSVTEEEGLHKGYDRFQKILSQLNQVQARPDNDDINLKFLRALPSSCYGVKVAAAPTHSAFIGAVSSGSKLNCSNQQSIVPSVSQTSGHQDMIYEDFDQVDQLEMEELDLKWQMAMLSLRINIFEKKAGRKMNYNNQQPARFDRRKVRCYKCLQLGHFARECNVKTVDDKARYSAFKVTEVKTDEPKALVSVDSMVNWSDHAAENKTGEVEKVYGMMAGLHADNGGADVSEAAAEFAMMGISPKVQNCPLGCDSKINDLNNMYNNLDRLYNDCYIKVQAYQNAVKTLESQKDWYHKTQIALEEKIRILSANLENTTNTLSYTEKLHDQAQKEKKEWEVKFEATLARFEKWKGLPRNLKKSDKLALCLQELKLVEDLKSTWKDEVFDLLHLLSCTTEPVEEVLNFFHSWFVTGWGDACSSSPPSLELICPPYKSDIEETQVSYGSKSDNKTSETLSESNDFVSYDNSDKSSDSETYASCDSSLKTKTKDFPPAVDIKTLPESDVEDPNSTAGSPSFSCLENVKSPRIFCNKSGMNNRNVCKNNSVRVKKCFVCGSKLHLIKDCDFYNCVESVPCKSKAASVPAGSRNSPASVTAGGSDPAASRNRPAVNSAGRPNPAGWSKRPAPVSAGRQVSAGWLNPAARPYFRPSSVYFNNMYWPNLYDPMYMNKGRWGTAGDPSTDNDIGIVDSGCSRSMTGNKEKLDDFMQVKGGIYNLEVEMHFNLFSVSQICDKKNKVLFTDTDCLVLTEDFQLPDESQVVLRIPRKCDLYTFSISELQPEQLILDLVAWHPWMNPPDGTEGWLMCSPMNTTVLPATKESNIRHLKHILHVRSITEPLQMLHMDLFGPTNIRSIDQKYYSLVVTDDFSRVSITNPHNKTPYELIFGKVPQIGHLKPFGCQVTILNTSDHLGKFEGKADEGYLVGYAPNSKAYRVYNLTNKRVEETMNLRFLEDKPNVQGIGHEWYFDLDYLTDSFGYTRFKTNKPAGPSSSNGPSVMERNADYAEELAKLQRQEYEAKDAAARYGYLDPAGIDSAGGVSAGSTSAGSDPATGNPTGSFEPADKSNPANSSSVSADNILVDADESTLPPGQSLGSSANTTRFPLPSDVSKD